LRFRRIEYIKTPTGVEQQNSSPAKARVEKKNKKNPTLIAIPVPTASQQAGT